MALLQAKSGAEAMQVLKDHPELLEDEADITLQQLISNAKQHGDARAEKIFSQRREFLRPLMSSITRELFQEGSELFQILRELSKPAQPRDMPKRIDLCHRALELITPSNSHIRAVFQLELGNSLTKSPLGDRADNIEHAIDLFEQALKVYTPDAFPEQWAMCQRELANAYNNRIRSDRADNVERAIYYCEQALTVYTQKAFPTDWAMTQNNLAIAYNNRILGDRADNIEQAMEHYKEALIVYTPETFPEQWAMIQTNLALAHNNRNQGDRAYNLEHAINYCERSLRIYTSEAFPEQWATTQNNLANAYNNRIHGNRADNIEQAIKHYMQALIVYTPEAFPTGWAVTQNNLATAYNNRIQGDRAYNLEQAVNYYEQSLKVYTPEAFPEQWAMTQNNLAVAYNNRIQGDRADNIEQAIEHCKEALRIRTPEALPEHWATTQINLANAYNNRIKGDRADNIEQAIEHHSLAIKVCRPETFPEKWAATQNNLALAYNNRIQGNRADNIEQAIYYCEQALTVYTQKGFPVDWAMIQNNLAATYNNRIRGDQAGSIEKAIFHTEQALKVYTQEDFPTYWAGTQNNLAAAYNKRIQGDRADNIERAIKHYKQALKVYTQEDFPADWAEIQNNLAVAYNCRIREERSENLERAIEHYNQALKVYTPREFPSRCRSAAYWLGYLCQEGKRISQAGRAYTMGMEAAEELYNASIFQSSRETELTETRDLYRRAGYTLAVSGDAIKAVEALERGRARGLGDALTRDRADLERVRQKDQEVYELYGKAVQELQNLESQERAGVLAGGKNAPQMRDLMMQAQGRLDETVNGIRQIPGYDNFLKKPGWEEIAASAVIGQPIVYLVAASTGGLALIVHRSLGSQDAAVDIVNLDSFSEQHLQEILDSWFKAYRGWQESLRNNMISAEVYLQAQKKWFDAIESITGQLWQDVMEPVFGVLQSLKAQQVFLIPTGLLSLLPLHAAWRKDGGRRQYLLEMIPVSYVPSVLSLAHARRMVSSTGSEKLLSVDEPKPVKASPLRNSNSEVSAISSLFKNPVILEHEKATRSTTLRDLPGAQVAHFSCHGGADWSDPEKSGLLMANGEMLTVKDLFELHLDGARLATLSACETGVPGTKLPDEVVSLPSAFIRAGFAGAIGSLWTVPDESTAELMKNFYQLWRQKPGLNPVQALTNAQQKLRESKKFQHPFYWAAFYITGV